MLKKGKLLKTFQRCINFILSQRILKIFTRAIVTYISCSNLKKVLSDISISFFPRANTSTAVISRQNRFELCDAIQSPFIDQSIHSDCTRSSRGCRVNYCETVQLRLSYPPRQLGLHATNYLRGEPPTNSLASYRTTHNQLRLPPCTSPPTFLLVAASPLSLYSPEMISPPWKIAPTFRRIHIFHRVGGSISLLIRCTRVVEQIQKSFWFDVTRRIFEYLEQWKFDFEQA